MRNGLRRYINPRNRDPIPGMSLLFARDKALDPMVDFTRASDNASYYNAAGVLSYAALNEPRFTHDPVTGQSLGLLIEESRTNLLTYSEEFDNGVWTKLQSTISSNAGVAPDGASTADSITTTGVGDGVSHTATITANSTNTLTFFVKSTPSAQWLRIVAYQTSATANRVSCWFDVLNGESGQATSGGTGSGASVSFISLKNGWHKVSLSGAINNSATGITVQVSTASANGSTTGVSGVSYFAWGAQLEAGSFPTSYIKTTSSAATRAADNASITGANFSSWYNQVEGSVVINARTAAGIGPGSNQYAFCFNDGTNNNMILANRLSALSAIIVASGLSQASFDGFSSGNSTDFKMGFSFAVNDSALTVDARTLQTDISLAIPTVDRMTIANRADGARAWNSTIASIAYYPKALPGYLQYLTS